jgi:mxaJ protein
MCSRFLSAAIVITLLSLPVRATTIKVCADPHNLPFSNQQQEGFENKIAKLLARDLSADVSFEWHRMGRGFVRNVLNTGACDVLLGVPVGMRGLLVTQPYYRSSYVFVQRADAKLVQSLDDPSLRTKTIGVQILEEDYAPPATALARRGLSSNVRGYDMDEDPGAIVAAVADRKVDIAVVWGPLAGYFTARYGKRLRIQPLDVEPNLPLVYSIAAGVRKNAPELHARLNAALAREREPIQQILHRYHVPVLPPTQEQASSVGGAP